MMCPGNSRSKIYEELLMLNDGTVNWDVPYDDLCSEKHVNVAYNQEDGVFELDNATAAMVQFPLRVTTGRTSIPWEYEISTDFYKWNNVIPRYFGKP